MAHSLTNVTTSRSYKGFSFPGIIHNGNYFLTEISVYEDGLVDCWGMVDLKLFKKHVKSGWVKPAIPDGAELNIHHLGVVQVLNPNWERNPRQLVKYVNALVTELNPKRRNLFDMYGDATDHSGPVKQAKVMRQNQGPWQYEEPNSFLARTIVGKSKYLFMNHEGKTHLVSISIFQDDTVSISGLNNPQTMSFDEFAKLFEKDTFVVPQTGQVLNIPGLVEFEAGEVFSFSEVRDHLGEFENMRREVNGQLSLERECARVFEEYNTNPTHDNLEALREAYEAVPNHLRQYCGDMDTKDIPIRIALYGDQEIEDWTHRIVAEQQGLPLPTIEVPKVKD